MGNVYWIGKAADVRQRDTITIAGTPAAGETVTLTINGKALVVTIGTDTTTTDVAEAIVLAWNATQRTSDAATGLSNFGGQEHGEFAEITCTSSGAVVTLLGPAASGPSAGSTSRRGPSSFVLSVSETMGSGTASHTTVATCTGKSHWNNVANWDTGAAPTDDDIVIFRDSDVDCLYGLPTADECTLITYMSYTGRIGLPKINAHIPSKPYYEYRTRIVQFDAGGTGTAITHLFGIGEGPGSPLINFAHDGDGGLTVSALVYNTGTPQIAGTKALNLEIANSTSVGTITVQKGSVNLGSKILSTTLVATLNVGYAGSQTSDSDVWVTGTGGALTISQSGGTVLFTDQFSMAGNLTLDIRGGRFVSQMKSTANTVTATVANGTLVWSSVETIDTLILATGGVLDLEQDMRTVTIATCDMYEGASLLDEYARGSYSAGIDLNRCGIDDVTIRVGNNRRLTLGTAA